MRFNKTNRRTALALGLGLVFLFASLSLGADVTDTTKSAHEDKSPRLTNPFDGFETWTYPSGLRVWFKEMKNETVSISVTYPMGAFMDEKDQDGLAHFVEHMMFTDNHGKTEKEIKAEIEDLGGQWNGFTSKWRTYYYIDLPASEGEFGLDWMFRLLSGHRFEDSVVDEERKAVILEASLKPKDIMDWIVEVFFDPDWARSPSFWEREFGVDQDARRINGSYESLQGINKNDLQAFYDRYYGPENMLLTVVGGVSSAQFRPLMESTFGTLEARGKPFQFNLPYKDPNRFRRSIQFHDSGTVRYSMDVKFTGLSSDSFVTLKFLTQLLREELHDTLRVERKTTYGVTIRTTWQAQHAYMHISGDFNPDDFDYAKQTIDNTLQALSQGSMPEDRFEELRQRVIAALIQQNDTPANLRSMAYSIAIVTNRKAFPDMPDPVSRAQNITQEELASFVSLHFVAEQTVISETRIQPINILWQMLLFPAWLILFYGLIKRWWIQPVHMPSIRYVAKIQYSMPVLVLGGTAAILVTVLWIQVIALAFSYFEWWVEGWGNYFVRIGIVLLWNALALLGIMLIPAVIPWKILLFEDHWRIKFFSLRSWRFSYEEIRELETPRLLPLLFSKKAFGCWVLHAGPFRQGLYVRVGKRLGFFFKVRDGQELKEQFEARRMTSAADCEPDFES